MNVNSNILQLHNETLLTPDEEVKLDTKIEYEIVKSHYDMIKVGAFTNILSGLFIFIILYGEVTSGLLSFWYGTLIAVNGINIWWSYHCKQNIIYPQKLKAWRRVFYYIFGCIALLWGSIGILSLGSSLNYQLYAIAFLLAVVTGFSFASITDFKMALISINSLLLPTIIVKTWVGIHSFMTIGQDPNLNLGISVSLFILGTFLLVACFIGAKLVRRYFRASFLNAALSEKLENLNHSLEQRVKERTLELEDSLKLVTYQATHDLLTDLPNQRLLINYIQTAMDLAKKNNHMFGVIFFTLNELEKINDGLGHQASDVVINQIAKRFQQDFRRPLDGINFTVTLSRKDVFVILVNPVTETNVEAKAELLYSVLKEPVYTENQVIKLTASMGISLFPLHGSDIKSLLMNADAAMLQAKQHGGNCVHMYQTEINAGITQQLAMESHLHTALGNSEFILHYQPFVDIRTGKIVGAEALVRWQSPVLGFISPQFFIPLAEANGIIIPLGEWVLRTACYQIAQWKKAGFNLQIAVNLSAKQLQQKNILSIINHILKENNLPSSALELELTESTAFQKQVIPILQQFKAIGLSLSIDDFGTGYSGLSNLKLIAIDKLKIDKSFVQDVQTNDHSRVIVENTINLAKRMNIHVLAEGVETQEQLQFLLDNECDFVQGYYFSPPLTADAFTQLLKDKKNFII